MALLKEDGSLDIERINKLPLEEHMNEIGSFTREQFRQYVSTIPLNEGKSYPHFIRVDVPHGVDAEEFMNKMKENIEGGDYINREKLHERIMSLLNEVCDTYDFGENGALILRERYTSLFHSRLVSFKVSMAYAREIFIAIKQKIRFQQADKEADSHYTVLGNTLVRISNHCTWMKIWDNYLQKNPQDAKRNILSLVFEDGEDTYTEECLFTVTERKKPIRVTEYVFKSASLSKQDVKMIIGSLQQMMTTNKFNEPTGKGERFDRISVNPDYMNIETTADRRAIPAGGHGMDYSIPCNFNNIKRDFETEHNGASFDKVIEMIRNGVSNEITEEFKDWSENWFWQTFGTYNIKYNFAEAANEFLEGMEK